MDKHKIDKWQELSDHAQVVFTPRAPIMRRDLFVGRLNQINQMIDAIGQPGAHAIVYGERGVGKTSLVTILKPILDYQKLTGYVVSKIQCDSKDTFHSICSKMFSNLKVTANEAVVSNIQTKLPLPETLDMWISENPNPDEIRRLILTLGDRQLIAIIDEFDSIANNHSVTYQVANLIKTLSDTASKATVILVGIADTVSELIKEHASVDRCILEIHMPRMTGEEMRQVISTGTKELKMSMEDDAIRYICRIAQGLPSYVHLLSRESAFVAIEQKSINISKENAITGLDRALQVSPGILLQDWVKATSSTKSNNLFKQVLFACALAPKNELGFFTAKSVQEPFRKITGKPYDIAGYGQNLHLLTEPQRASVLEKRGQSHGWLYRFRNPLMEPYIIMHGLKYDLIDEGIVSLFRQDPLPKN